MAAAAQELGANGIWQQGRMSLTCGTIPLLAKAKCGRQSIQKATYGLTAVAGYGGLSLNIPFEQFHTSFGY